MYNANGIDQRSMAFAVALLMAMLGLGVAVYMTNKFFYAAKKTANSNINQTEQITNTANTVVSNSMSGIKSMASDVVS